jgi:hypothetical protein
VICFFLWLAVVAISGPAQFDGVSASELFAVNVRLSLFGL